MMLADHQDVGLPRDSHFHCGRWMLPGVVVDLHPVHMQSRQDASAFPVWRFKGRPPAPKANSAGLPLPGAS